MKIDIITYTDAQYAVLTEEQLLEIKSAQLKKDRLDARREEALLKEKLRLIDNGTYLSAIWELQAQKLRDKHALEVAGIRESLLFYLKFSSKVDVEEHEGLPYVPKYALAESDRYNQVKDAYFTKFSDPNERFEAFKADKVAPKYLGEGYSILYDYILYFTAGN